MTNHLLNAAVWGDSYDIYNTADALGFKTNSFHHAVLSPTQRLSEDFLVNSRLRRHDPELNNSIEMYLEDAGVSMISLLGNEDMHANQCLSLPESIPLHLEVGAALVRRRSARQYTGDKISCSVLATIIRSAMGVTASAEITLEDESQVRLHFRSIPSSGGLYPLDLYIVVIHVQGINPGIYRYLPKQDQLIKVADQDSIPGILDACSVSDDSINCSRANALFLLSGQAWRCMRKYGNRGMRFLFQECGAIAQNINLAVTALGLGSVECGGFYDDEVNKLLKLDGVFNAFLHAIVVGVSE